MKSSMFIYPTFKKGTSLFQLTLIIVLSFLISVPASATIFPVDATIDASDADLNDGVCDDGSGNCTLRAAVEQANHNAGTDTIYLPIGTYVLTLGDLDLNSDLYISGEGEAVTTIDGNHNSRIFFIASGFTVTVDSTKLQNGFESSAGGGAIHNEGTLTIEDCTLFADTATIGGGIYNLATGDLTITRCTIKNNQANGWGAAHGGGIYNRGICEIFNSEIAENSSVSEGGSGNGGGIHNTSSIDLKIHNSEIRENSISGILAFGGGIYNGNSPIKIYGSEISGNHTQSFDANRSIGGGIYAVYSSGTWSDTVTNTVIKDNTVISVNQWAGGGGIYYNGWSTSEVTMVFDKVMVQGNSATSTIGNAGYGGGILCSGSEAEMSIFNSLITGNLASGATNAYGGGIRHRDGSMDILNSTINGNKANNGGGIYYHSGTLALGNTIIAGNDAASQGPDIFEALAPTTDGGNLIGDNSDAPTFPSGSPNANNDFTGTGESPLDPLLEEAVDPSNAPDSGGDFHLQDGSVAIENGLDVLVIGVLSTDIEGNDRRLDGDDDNTIQVDIGAYEKVFIPLPVELISFNTECKDNIIHISWTVASEINNQYFVLERSVDNNSWTRVANVEGAGNNWIESTYNYKDFLPQALIGQAIYYRLSQIDYDGKINFLGIEVASCKEKGRSYKVFPNPTSGMLVIEINSPSVTDVTLTLIDGTGRVLNSDYYVNTGAQTTRYFDLSNYPEGIYLLNIETRNDLKSFRVVKVQY